MDDNVEHQTAPFGSAGERASADEMDEKRHQDVAYEYLCRLEEAKLWVESCINEELPPTTELEENLRNGVYLAKLGNYIYPEDIPLKKLYDINQTRYKSKGLHFRHTDNINYWIRAMKRIGLPQLIIPETTDIFEKKNIPKVIYCLHTLSVFLHNSGKAPQIKNLLGKVQFTDEEISNMSKELLTYGIQMPMFGTIGGILAREIPVDEATRHAGIIAINDAIDRKVDEDILTALLNPNASLLDVDSLNIEIYREDLSAAKCFKLLDNEKRIDVATDLDAYDELLTKEEIQQCVYNVNSKSAFLKIKLAIDGENCEMLINALRCPCLGLSDVLLQNANCYYEKFKKFRNKDINNNLGCAIEDLQKAIKLVNSKVDENTKKQIFVSNVNDAIVNGYEKELLKTLMSFDDQMPSLKEIGSRIYFQELTANRQILKRDLNYDEIKMLVDGSRTLICLNLSVEAGDVDATCQTLNELELEIANVDCDYKFNYWTAMVELKKQKKLNEDCVHLTRKEVQECVMLVNSLASEEKERIIALQRISDAIRQDNRYITLKELNQPILGLPDVYSENVDLYHQFLQAMLHKKLSVDAEEIFLWPDEIEVAVDAANNLTAYALQCCKILAKMHLSVCDDDLELFTEAITDSKAGFSKIMESCIENYFSFLKSIFVENSDNVQFQLYTQYREEDSELIFFYELKTRLGIWRIGNSGVCLTREMIQEIVSEVNMKYDREVLKKSLEPQIVIFQAYIRGKLVRNIFYERLFYLHSKQNHVLKIQAWWRGCRQRKLYLERCEYWKSNTDSIIKVQACVRLFLARSKYRRRLLHLKSQEKSVIKIQASWRACKIRKAFKELMTSNSPSFSSVQMFLHLLDIKNTDFSEELNLHQLQGEIVKIIRENRRLENDLSVMDTKIGLLVKNRITLQDVIAHGKKLNKSSKEEIETNYGNSSIQSKENHAKIECYQHLFYLLQSDPSYLSKLIFLMQQNKETKFIESIVLTIFNYASNNREEYLLLKLFRAALIEEIKCKVDIPSDIITGNSLIIKMIVGFNRNKGGQNSLREMLSPLVTEILNDKNLKINTNPVEVYTLWVNHMESQTGQPSGLPYNVDQDEALKHDEVVKRLQASIEHLKFVTLSFLDAITNSLDKIPYGMLYMAKVLKSSLEIKFPNLSPKEIIKVVGNLLYYRYINPAIVAPDAFGIIDVGVGVNLTQDQRRNLASIAKILQFSTSKIGFGSQSPHLMCLNSFIIECYEKFTVFLKTACQAEELETHFSVDEYSESLSLTKPTIYISQSEISELHALLLENEAAITADSDDPLHELLEDLGNKQDASTLTGKSDICLNLNSKFSIPESKKTETNQLFLITRQMIVDVMHCFPAKSISEMLKVELSENMNLKFKSLLEEKHQQFVKGNDDARNFNISYEGSSLDETIQKIGHNLNLLQVEGYTSSDDDHQNILNTIALDIRNRHRYRKQRKQDLSRMGTTLTNLKTKMTFFEEQVDCYNIYIKQCLKNKEIEKKSKANKKLKTSQTLKYTGLKLHEKGIIKDIEGLSKNQFKNVLFEISPTETDGSFAVKVKYMGTSMADVKIDIQNLLERQYEGISVMKMFDGAQVNLNLLLFLLNTKFYGQA